MTTTPFGAELHDVTVRYGRGADPALGGATVTIRPGTITGLLGRNGAGKSTAAALLAGFRASGEGRVLVGEEGALEDPFENAWTAAHTQLVREGGDLIGSEPVRDTFEVYADRRPTWDADLAHRLLDTFEISDRVKPDAMSRGQRSAVGATIGLASRAPLTILDEVYLGMDAPSRYAFYDAMVADYAEHPRTIVLSSHLIGEVERLFEDVVVMDRGRVLVAESADELRSRGSTLTGPTAVVDAHLGGLRMLARRQLGGTSEVTLFGDLDADHRAAARAAGLEIGTVGIQDLFVHLTRATTQEEQS